MLRICQPGNTNLHRGSGTSVSLVYLAVVSLLSLAAVTVSMKDEVSVSSVMNWICPDDCRFKSLLSGYFGDQGTINRQDNSSASVDKQNTLWNPLAKVWLTEEQVHLLKSAYTIAYKDGGLEHARLIQAVLLQETIAGLLGRIGHLSAPVGKRSYGVMQVKVSAAHDVMRKHSEFGVFGAEEELIVKLMSEDEFNIRIASRYFLHLRAKTKTDAQALLAYNMGLRGSRRFKNYETFRYVKKVMLYSDRVVIPFNRKFNNLPLSTVRRSTRQLAAAA